MVREGETSMSQGRVITHKGLKTPKAAAIAGVVFSLLLIVGLGLSRFVVPSDLSQPGSWLTEPDRQELLGLALDLVPFAGIAFLWFMGVLRNRLGELEDQFFATVFLGSGLLFVASLFTLVLMAASFGAFYIRRRRI